MENHGNPQEHSIDTLLESSLESVDAAEESVLEFGREIGLAEDDLYQLGMAVRESMVNAVVHGNRYNANKKVHFSIHKENEHMVVRIRDEGEGFDLSDLPDPLSEDNLLRQSGRGIYLIQAFVDEFSLRKSEAGGTEVMLAKKLGPKAE